MVVPRTGAVSGTFYMRLMCGWCVGYVQREVCGVCEGASVCYLIKRLYLSLLIKLVNIYGIVQ